MKKPSTGAPSLSERVVLVIEVVHTLERGRGGVSVVASLAGRESVYEKDWPAVHGLPNSRQLDDICGYVSSTVRHQLVSFVGVQEMLEA